MSTTTSFAQIATLAGDPARVRVLHGRMDGRALSAGELARAAGIAPQTASAHLGRLVSSGIIAVKKQARIAIIASRRQPLRGCSRAS